MSAGRQTVCEPGSQARGFLVGEGGDQGEQGEDGGELLAVGLVVSVEERGEEHAPHQAVQEDGAGPPVPALAVGQKAAGAKVLG